MGFTTFSAYRRKETRAIHMLRKRTNTRVTIITSCVSRYASACFWLFVRTGKKRTEILRTVDESTLSKWLWRTRRHRKRDVFRREFSYSRFCAQRKMCCFYDDVFLVFCEHFDGHIVCVRSKKCQSAEKFEKWVWIAPYLKLFF